ncbi:uncharacterized protein Bfra_004820 [Botrytis fragariae]|uniref:Uncharacterized protein n=1 Tax=Botrytis fragariae TaxID=1964551 RepID=A0A8H6EID2_9HELO|nr:uncharacterized protein Bfra_004820 [Botrytis fragariae]KAF5873362.1 hypothetical protein Bfra_004820 [Botrytis fragariae]
MASNIPGIDAADLRRYINLDLPIGNPAPVFPAVPPLPAAPAHLPALPVRILPAGSNAPAVVATPVEEQPVPSWPGNPKAITGSHQPLTIWPGTSNKDPSLNYVQGKYVFVPGEVDVVGSRAWLLRAHPGAREGLNAWFLAGLLGRNGWTNNRVIVDAYTRMYEPCAKKFGVLVVGSDEYVKQWESTEALIRQTMSKIQYNDLFIKKGDANIVGDEARQGECLWRLRQPWDPPKPDSKKGKRGPRSHRDGDGNGPAGDPNSAHEKRDGGPEDQPAAKKR